MDFFVAGGGGASAGLVQISDRGQGTDADNRIRRQLFMDAASNEITVFRASFGETSSGSAVLTTISSAGIYDGGGHHIRVQIDPGTTNTAWSIYIDGCLRRPALWPASS
ncbi:hypothetical protein ACWDR3_43395 [Streptomyces sp. NPDC001002]